MEKIMRKLRKRLIEKKKLDHKLVKHFDFHS